MKINPQALVPRSKHYQICFKLAKITEVFTSLFKVVSDCRFIFKYMFTLCQMLIEQHAFFTLCGFLYQAYKENKISTEKY